MKRGFSFTTLSATVSAMLILLTSVTIGTNNAINSQKKLAFSSELTLLKQAVDSYKIKNNGLYPVKESVILDISKLDSNTKTQFISNQENIVNNKITLNEIDYSKLGIVSLKYGNLKDGENDIYAISPKTGELYYAKGMKFDGKIYFCLSDDITKKSNKNMLRSNFKEAKYIIFEPSDINWTNKDIELKIKLPKKYRFVSIMVDENQINDYTTSQDMMYNIYTIKRSGSYTVTVNYQKNDDNNVYKEMYNVDNVDKNPPILKFKKNTTNLGNTNENIIGYYNIIEKKDLESGIKKIKYEKNSSYVGTINDEKKSKIKSHFEISGKDVLNDIIPIENGTNNIVVYIEDNAGNWLLQTLK